MDDRRILGRWPAACALAFLGLSSAPLGAQPGEAALEAELEAERETELATDDAPREVLACLDHTMIRRTRVLNNRNIVFITRDNEIYNNQLPKECPSLRRGSLVSYPIEQRRLCSGGSFQVLWQTGAANNSYTPAFVCHLGYFVPISESELEDLTAATDSSGERRPRRRSRREAITTKQVELPPADESSIPTEPAE